MAAGLIAEQHLNMSMAACAYSCLFLCYGTGERVECGARTNQVPVRPPSPPPQPPHHRTTCALVFFCQGEGFYSHCWSAWLSSTPSPPSPFSPPPKYATQLAHNVGMASSRLYLKCWNVMNVKAPYSVASCHTCLFIFWFLVSLGSCFVSAFCWYLHSLEMFVVYIPSLLPDTFFSMLRHYAASRKVSVSRSDEVNVFI
jgi:hypothetical protein